MNKYLAVLVYCISYFYQVVYFFVDILFTNK